MDNEAFRSSHVIQAQPGCRLVYSNPGEDRIDAEPRHFDAIIAWRMDTLLRDDEFTTSTTPLTYEGSPEANNWAIVWPTGIVEVPFGETFGSVKEYFASMRERPKGKP
ncbi:hypothetical protein [Novosphingobium sp.]|uniref:hypothetical protein n=1 Tax=Novosphingobium sp. TaxID=1874826 RepID=UPI003D0DF9FD